MRICSLFLALFLLVSCQKEFDTPATATRQGNKVSITVQKVGSLASFLESSSIDFYSVDRVVFTGTLNGKDVLEAVRLSSVKGNVKELDFSQVHVLEDAFPKAAFATANLNKLIFPKKLTHTGLGILYGANTIKDVEFSDNLEFIDDFGFMGEYEKYNLPIFEIPATVRHLGSYAFKYASYYASATIALPEELETMGEGVFMGTDIIHQKIPHKIKNLPRGTFIKCFNLETVILPKDTERIGFQAFHYCISLENTDFLPDAVKVIEGFAFENCQMKTLRLPKNLERLENYALARLVGVEELRLPDKVSYIGDFCFSGYAPNNLRYLYPYKAARLTPLKRIYLPKSVTHIGGSSFTNLSQLEEIHVKWETPIPHNNCFASFKLPDESYEGIDRSKVILYVPKGTSQAYHSAEGWKEFTHIVEE